MPKVSVIWPDKPTVNMLQGRGYTVVTDTVTDDLDFVVFTGGADLNPALYGEENKGSVGIDMERDEHDVNNYILARTMNIPIMGICRGGQLVNVMNRGGMIQHVGGLSMGNYSSTRKTPYTFLPSTTVFKKDHHQVMLPGPDSEVLYASLDGVPDVIFYPKTRSMAFQPHPEWGHETTRDIFFLLYDVFFDAP